MSLQTFASLDTIYAAIAAACGVHDCVVEGEDIVERMSSWRSTAVFGWQAQYDWWGCSFSLHSLCSVVAPIAMYVK